MAGLFVKSPTVSVGPPLFPNADSFGSVLLKLFVEVKEKVASEAMLFPPSVTAPLQLAVEALWKIVFLQTKLLLTPEVSRVAPAALPGLPCLPSGPPHVL